MRIISGRLGGQHFDTPTNSRTHPMSDKARGGLFGTLGDIEGLTFLDAFAGSGGLSSVSARPAWQTGVPGIPSQGGRALPDISMFASSGVTWNQTLILCDSGLVNMPAGTACDFSNADDVYANTNGGTSFVAPAFAGIMALINQKSGDRQGQANVT